MKKAFIILLLAVFAAPVFAAQNGAYRHLSGSGTGNDPAIYQRQGKPLHGNFKTMKYHNEFCDHYNCQICTTIFKTKAAAEKAGYVPCGKCGG